MSRLTHIFRRLLPSVRTGNSCDFFHRVDRMNAILQRERMRSDRGNASFALVTFTFPTACSDAELAALGQVFRDRIRATDDAGLFGPRCIGVILPETSVEGAWKLGADLNELFPPSILRPERDVYLYPVHPANDKRTKAASGETVEAANGETVEIANGQTVEAANGEMVEIANGETVEIANGEMVEVASGKSDYLSELPAGAVQAMHAFFERPLPAWKRAIDVVAASVALLVATPVMLLAAVAIKLTSPGPVIFTQRRDTMGGRPFTIYKFRTMCVDAEWQKAHLRSLSAQDGPAFKMSNDPRVTWIGGMLRKTSVDELPQLFNVLLGNMSLVGPRPLPCDESHRCESWQRRRLDVTPGITCIWQVRGRSSVPFCDWIRMDIQYIRSRSLVNDVKLIAQTVPAVVLRRGAC